MNTEPEETNALLLNSCKDAVDRDVTNMPHSFESPDVQEQDDESDVVPFKPEHRTEPALQTDQVPGTAVASDIDPTSGENAPSSTGIGRFCSAAGVKKAHFDQPDCELPSLNVIQNGAVIELHCFLVGKLKYSLKDMGHVVLRLLGRQDVNINTVVSAIWRLMTAYKKRKKHRGAREDFFNELLEENFKIARKRDEQNADTPRKKKLKGDLKESRQQLKSTRRLLLQQTELLQKETCQRQTVEELNKELSEEVDGLHDIVNTLTKEHSKMLKDMEEMTQQFDPVKHQLSDYTQRYNKLTADLAVVQEKYAAAKLKLTKIDTRNVNRKLKRKDQKITELQGEKLQARQFERSVDQLKEELQDTKKELQATEEAVNEVQEKLGDEKAARKRLSKQAWYSKKRQLNEYLDHDSYTKELSYLQKRVTSLSQKNKELEDLVALLQDETVISFQDGRYSDEIRETIMELLACNVSMAKVSKVIKVVVEKLGKRKMSRLPSLATISQIAVEARHIADIEVATAMYSNNLEDTLGNCLHGDGTTKYHKKYQNFQVTLPDGSSRTLGLSQLAKGDTESTLKAFQDRLHELAHALSSSGADGPEQDIYDQLLCTFKSTMTDQGPAMPQFSRHVQSLREDLLPKVMERWTSLPTDVQSTVKEFGTFFCKMHPLINFSDEINKVLKCFEDISYSGKNPHVFQTAEAGVTRLVRTTSKAFNHRGSDKSGVEDAFSSYLEHEFDVKNHVVNYVGNRANILFEGAAATYFHHRHISSFISILPDPNHLLLAIKEDISEPLHLAELRALGIIHQTITEPLWRKIKGAVNILSLNTHLHDLQKKLVEWKEDATPLLRGSAISPDIPVIQNAFTEKLFEEMDPEGEAMCIQALEMASCAMLLILDRQCQDQLPGGKYWDVSEPIASSFSNVPTTNVIAERDFAQLDLLVRVKPAARTLTLETLIMWVNNQTPTWLNSLDADTKKKYMAQARGHSREILERYRKRMTKIKAERWALLQEKQQKKKEREEKQRNQTVALVNDVMSLGGVWTSVEMADSKYTQLQEQGQNVARKAIYHQLQFMQKTLKCDAPNKSHFQLSCNQIQFTNSEMLDHLKEIIETNEMTKDNNDETPDASTSTSGLRYTDKQIREEMVLKKKEEMGQRIENERQKRAAESSQKHLRNLLENPHALVGKRVNHLFRFNHEKKWYSGTVVRIEKEHANTMKTAYAVDYDLEAELEVYPLLQDLKKSELVIHM